jgi:DNA primase
MVEMWTRASDEYHSEYWGSPAQEYVQHRGLDSFAGQFRLGYVESPAPGHEERFKGMLSIPYLTPNGVVGFKFRAIEESTKKYLIPTALRTHLYNVRSANDPVNEVLIVEGELDAIAATSVGFPAVAVAGANSWKSHFHRCFDGIGRVIIVTDNDKKDDGSNPGQELAKKIADQLPNAIRVSLPHGEDVNSTILNYGAQHFTSLVKSLDESEEYAF